MIQGSISATPHPGVLLRLLRRLAMPWLRYQLSQARRDRKTKRLIHLCQTLGAWGDVEAQFTLGRCYSSGHGVTRNLPTALRWLRLAAEQGQAEAMYQVALFHLHGPQLENDASLTALRCYGGGEDSAQENARLLFPEGLVLAVDHAEAVRWLQRAADKGQVDAICQLGVQYARGEGVEQDSARAVSLLRSACDKGVAQAHFILANFQMTAAHGLECDMAEGMRLLEFAARHEHLGAALQLGNMLLAPDMPRNDPKEAEHWLTSAAQRGHVQAMTSLARLYSTNTLGEKDDARAAAWYRKAAAQGEPTAQWHAALQYHHGRGVEKDLYEAAYWYEKAGRQGVGPAQYALAMMYRTGQGVLRNDKIAAEWFTRAADGGDVRAMINLALLHLSGTLDKRDPAEANRLFSLAEATTSDQATLAEIEKFRTVHRIGRTPPETAGSQSATA